MVKGKEREVVVTWSRGLLEPVDELGEVLAVVIGEGVLLLRRLARAVSSRDGARAVLTAPNDLGGVKEYRVGVSKGHVDHAKVNKLHHSGQGHGFLSAVLLSGGEEDPCGLANEGALLPVAAQAVEEGLHLLRHHSKAGRDPEENAVGLGELVAAGVKDRQIDLGSVHLGQHCKEGERRGGEGKGGGNGV